MPKNDEGVETNGQDAPLGEKEVKVGDSGASSEGVVEPDWKELLRLEQERREQAEADRDNYKEGLLSRKRQEKVARVEGDTTDEDDRITSAVQKALEPVVSALAVNKVDQILASMVADPSKREYVKSLYQSRIQRTGTSEDAIRLDLEVALTLADASRKTKEVEELKRMNGNKTYIPPTGGGSGSADRGVAQKPHKWTPEQEASLESRARANGIADIEKYKALAWKASQEGSAFEVKKKYL
jgi:hypothetical protein